MTPKRWIESTNAINVISKSGRYGGTFAHKDIALEFAKKRGKSQLRYIDKLHLKLESTTFKPLKFNFWISYLRTNSAKSTDGNNLPGLVEHIGGIGIYLIDAS